MTQGIRTAIAAVLFAIAAAYLLWRALASLPQEIERDRRKMCVGLKAIFEDKPAPAFALRDYAGRSVDFAAYRGRVVFLNFWATWCPPCVEEMASLERMAETFAARKDFAVVTVSEDKGFEEIRQFFAQGTKLTVLLDDDWKVAKAFGTEKLPETYLIDRDGTLRYRIVNQRDWSGGEALACIQSMLD